MRKKNCGKCLKLSSLIISFGMPRWTSGLFEKHTRLENCLFCFIYVQLLAVLASQDFFCPSSLIFEPKVEKRIWMFITDFIPVINWQIHTIVINWQTHTIVIILHIIALVINWQIHTIVIILQIITLVIILQYFFLQYPFLVSFLS